MSRRKPIDAKILEAGKEFNAEVFVETVKGAFADLLDYRRNQNRVLYPVWYLSLVVLCGFFCGCNTIEEISDYAGLQEDWFSSLLGEKVSAPSHGALRWFLVKTPAEAFKSYIQKWFRKIPGALQGSAIGDRWQKIKGANSQVQNFV